MSALIPAPPIPGTIAETQDALHRRWAYDPRGMTLRAMEAVINRASQNILSVLALWDEDKACWAPRTPTLLRMEQGDITLFPMDDIHITASFKPIDPAMPFDKAGTPGSRLTWRPFNPSAYANGRRVASFAFGTCENGLLTCIEACLDDGGCLTIGVEGCGFGKAMRRTNPRRAPLVHAERNQAFDWRRSA